MTDIQTFWSELKIAPVNAEFKILYADRSSNDEQLSITTFL
jgi:hypothetical protein